MRFAGTVERLGPVDAGPVIAWITAIPLEVWPQQHRIGGQLRPAMVNSPTWQGFYAQTDALVQTITALVPAGLRPGARMLSVVMPGHAIAPHVDRQAPTWWGRVHVPLTTDPASTFVVGGVAHRLDVGQAYVMNTKAEHSMSNEGRVPRIHCMVDYAV